MREREKGGAERHVAHGIGSGRARSMIDIYFSLFFRVGIYATKCLCYFTFELSVYNIGFE